MRKLSDEQVVAIRSLAATTRLKDLSAQFGTDIASISRIARGLTYSDIPGDVLPTRNRGSLLKKKYGRDYFSRLGKKGGAASGTGGFYYLVKHGQRDKVVAAGIKGGKAHKRGSQASTDAKHEDEQHIT